MFGFFFFFGRFGGCSLKAKIPKRHLSVNYFYIPTVLLLDIRNSAVVCIAIQPPRRVAELKSMHFNFQ